MVNQKPDLFQTKKDFFEWPVLWWGVGIFIFVVLAFIAIFSGAISQ